jgi:hypothetical protein
MGSSRWFALLTLMTTLSACGAGSPAPPEEPSNPTPPESAGSAAPSLPPGASPAPSPAGSAAAPAASGAPADSPAAPVDPQTAERLAYERAKPVFQKHCERCHVPGQALATKKILAHFSMERYPFGGHHAADVDVSVRRVLGASGKKATMPPDKPGAVQGDELALVLAWADAFAAAHPRPAKKPHGHGGHAH